MIKSERETGCTEHSAAYRKEFHSNMSNYRPLSEPHMHRNTQTHTLLRPSPGLGLSIKLAHYS